MQAEVSYAVHAQDYHRLNSTASSATAMAESGLIFGAGRLTLT
jgi:hypothetical protein